MKAELAITGMSCAACVDRVIDFPGVSWVQLVLTGGGDP